MLSPATAYTPTSLDMCPHSGIIILPSEKHYLQGKYDKLKFSNNKVVYYNVPLVIVQSKLDVEIDFINDDEKERIREELTNPYKASSIPLDSNFINWKNSKFEDIQNDVIGNKLDTIVSSRSRQRSQRPDTINDSVSNPDSTVRVDIQNMNQQRTSDLLKNINRHAPTKKVQLFKEAFMNAEPLKIRKYQDKCHRNHETLKYITEKHEEIMKSKTIKTIIQQEQNRETQVCIKLIL